MQQLSVQTQERQQQAAGEAAHGGAPDRKRYRYLLITIVAVAALLRMRGLTSFPFEQDELYTWIEGRDLFDVSLKPGISGRPLYFLIQHVLLGWLPVSPLALRAFPFICGVAGVWVTALLARRVFGPTAGLIAAVITALAPWHLQASTFARYWSFLYLLAALLLLLLWRAYHSNARRDFIAALAVLVAGSATHPSFVFAAFGATLGLSLVTREGRFGLRFPSRAAWIYLWAPYLALLAIAVVALRATGSQGALQNWGGRGLFGTLRLVPAVIDWLTPTITVTGALGAIVSACSRQPDERRWGALAIAGVFVPLALLVYASTRTSVYSDYAFPTAPLVFVSVAGLVTVGVERVKANRGITAAIALIILVASMLPVTVSHLASGTRFDYRPALQHIKRTDPGKTVVTWPFAIAAYYAPDLRLKPLIMNTAQLDATLFSERDIWLIGSIRRYGLVEDPGRAVARWVMKYCLLEYSHQQPRWDYRIYQVDLYRCRAPAEPDRGNGPL